MKLIKLILFVAVIVVIFNWLGLFNSETSDKVDYAVDTVMVKVNSLEYKGENIADLSLKELSTSILSDISYIKDSVITEDGINLSSKGFAAIINPTKDKIIQVSIDPSNEESVKSAEKLLGNITNKDIKIPKKFLDDRNVDIVVERIEGEYHIKFE